MRSACLAAVLSLGVLPADVPVPSSLSRKLSPFVDRAVPHYVLRPFPPSPGVRVRPLAGRP